MLDTVITSILITFFGTSFISGIISDRQIIRFTKWLHANHYHDWLELGAPGTPFWKGQSKPGQEPRYRTAYNSFRRIFINSAKRFTQKYKEEEAQKILRNYRIANRISFIFLLTFGVTIFIAITLSP